MLTDLLITNIKSIIQAEEVPQLKVCGPEMSEIQTIDDAFLYIVNGLIDDFGLMTDLHKGNIPYKNQTIEIIDARGKYVFPSFCDSHTHLVYSGSR